MDCFAYLWYSIAQGGKYGLHFLVKGHEYWNHFRPWNICAEAVWFDQKGGAYIKSEARLRASVHTGVVHSKF